MTVSPGDIIAGRYQVMDLVGQGGMGNVYRARDTRLDRIVALKTLRADFGSRDEILMRFKREAMAAARLRSPHIATVHDYGIEGDLAYIVLDFLPGPTLQEILRSGPLRPDRAVRLLVQGCLALEEVHGASLVHRDIKPSNFSIETDPDGDEQVVLLDFGIAKILDRTDSVITGEHVIIGTLAYMSPEQARGSAQVDERSDLFSMGSMAFALLVGTPPFHGRGLNETIRAIVDQPAPSPRDNGASISAKLDAVVLRCLEKSPDARYASARALREALMATREAARASRRVRGPAMALPPIAKPIHHPTAAPPQEAATIEAVADSRAELLAWASGDGQEAATIEALADSSGSGSRDDRNSGAFEIIMGDALPKVHPYEGPKGTLLDTLIAILLFLPNLVTSPFLWLGKRLFKPSQVPTVPQAPRLAPLDGIIRPPENVPPDGPPRRPPATQFPDVVVPYVKAVGFSVTRDDGDLVDLEVVADRSLPRGRYVALRMSDGDADATAATMATIVFQRDALALYQLTGTPAEPCWVLLVDPRPPGVGVYREQHALARERHLRILVTRPQAMRAALQSGEAAVHFRTLLAQGRDDPFTLEGPIEDDLEFFGSSAAIRAMLDDIRTRHTSMGVFGLEKWGTTSLLRRVRAEILAGGGHPVAWVDCQAAARLTEEWLCDTIIASLQAMLAGQGKNRGGHVPATIDGVFALALRCSDATLPHPPVLFFDRADEIVEPRRVDADAAARILQTLRRLTRPDHDHPRVVVVLGGVHDGLIMARHLYIGDRSLDNPLWRVVKVHYTPLFTVDETAEFMLRMATRTGLELAADAVGHIHTLTGGHKYLCRLLGSEIRARSMRASGAHGQVDRELVDGAAQAMVLSHHDYFSALLDRAPPATRRLITRLATGELTHSELFELDRAGGGDLPSAADQLEATGFALRHQMIEEQRCRYRLVIQLFAQWLTLTQQIDAPVPALVDRGKETPRKETNVVPSANNSREGGGTIVLPAPVASGDAVRNAQQTIIDEDLELRKIMTEAFTSDELELLIADMGVSFQKVTSRSNRIDIQVLHTVTWFRRQKRLRELRAAVQRARPEHFAPDISSHPQ